MGFDNQKLLEPLLCRMMKHVAPPKGLAEDLPMQYAGFRFRVCVNDQLIAFQHPSRIVTREHMWRPGFSELVSMPLRSGRTLVGSEQEENEEIAD